MTYRSDTPTPGARPEPEPGAARRFTPSDFRVPRWTRGPHVQTLGARALRASDDPGMVRERWDTPDGDFVDVDLGPDPGDDAPVALVLHGLEGSSRRRYVRSVCRRLLARGVRPVALNFRGCSGEPNRLPRFYHSGETGDPGWVLARLRRRHPGRRVGALGFSLGANMLLKLLGERDDGGEALLDAAVAMSVPFDLAAGGRLLEATRMGSLYTAYFLRSLRKKVEAKRGLLEPLIDVGAALEARTLRTFDDAATAPLHGFRDADDYYAACSSAGFVGGIRVPTLVIHAEDDPFLPPTSIPRDALEGNPAVHLALTPRGGHVGFMEGPPWNAHMWGDEEGARFLAEVLGAG